MSHQPVPSPCGGAWHAPPALLWSAPPLFDSVDYYYRLSLAKGAIAHELSVRPLFALRHLLRALHSLLAKIAPQKAGDEHAHDQSVLFGHVIQRSLELLGCSLSAINFGTEDQLLGKIAYLHHVIG